MAARLNFLHPKNQSPILIYKRSVFSCMRLFCAGLTGTSLGDKRQRATILRLSNKVLPVVFLNLINKWCYCIPSFDYATLLHTWSTFGTSFPIRSQHEVGWTKKRRNWVLNSYNIQPVEKADKASLLVQQICRCGHPYTFKFECISLICPTLSAVPLI